MTVSLIWRSKWSLPKVLFLLSRYSSVFDVPLVLYYSTTHFVSVERCAQLHESVAWATVWGISVAEAILLLRTYALSGAKRSVLIIFGLFWAAGVSTTIVLVALYLKSAVYKLPPLPGIPGCVLAAVNTTDVVFPFVVVLMYDTIILAYTLYLGVKNYRHAVKTPLIVTLYRDGILYYVCLFTISLLNVFMLVNRISLTGQAFGQSLVNLFLRVMHSVLSTRILLHLREVERKKFESEREVPFSAIRFKGQTTLETDA
ncbi:hypothetical protein MSAN_00810000 [Mycena sanguinolenta]|uniref:Uncharacterized protein n=1 Tax=Mycena sanguinolenta TaxID=230812 RepID=A0A8H6YZ63_9AGAR|nr:hypothetical protein MSAN_00810000 [Mycena sanguinolenta]